MLHESNSPEHLQAWHSNTTWAVLQTRASIKQKIRFFFEERGVLEVDTPLLSATGTTDFHLHSLTVFDDKGRQQLGYLHTSPEFGMKRLLASFQQPIYQLAPVFRGREEGRYHAVEFLLLEWYRPHWTYSQLLDEVESLLRCLAGTGTVQRLHYCDVFQQHLGINPLEASVETLQTCALQLGLELSGMQGLDRDAWLDALLSLWIIPRHYADALIAIEYFPASQAALAELVSVDGQWFGLRFEVYWQGIELANGFQELRDAHEQQARFEQDLARRRLNNLPLVPMDRLFLQSLPSLPPCAGVALGIDRLMMLILGLKQLDGVFPLSMTRDARWPKHP